MRPWEIRWHVGITGKITQEDDKREVEKGQVSKNLNKERGDELRRIYRGTNL